MNLSSLGKTLVIMGAILLAVGGLLWLAGRTGFPLGWLPGEIRIEREAWSCYIPVVSMVVLGLVLTILLNVAVCLPNR